MEKALEETSNGNIIFNLKEVAKTKEEKKIFMDIINADSRIIDLEFDKDIGEVDIIAELDFCPNVDKGEEDEL